MPPGYIFKKKGEPKVEETNKESLEEGIDNRIAKLGILGVKVTLETYIL